MGVVDYEVTLQKYFLTFILQSDIIEVRKSVSLLHFSAVVESQYMGANCIFLKASFSCRWLHQATELSLVSIPSCHIERIGWQIANTSDKWYTPPHVSLLPQNRILTNENVFSGIIIDRGFLPVYCFQGTVQIC